MREQLNNNPMVQMAALGIAAVVFAFILFTSVLKKDDPAPATTTTAPAVSTDAGGGAVAPEATVDPSSGATVTPPVDSGTTAPPATTDPGAADGLLPSKGLPEDVLVAYAKGDAIALLVVDPKAKGTDKLVKTAEKGAGSKAKVFVVKVNDIAKYSRITQGVSVSRTPALVVVQPRKLSEGAPMATVTYDLTSPQSTKQAIADALYTGGNVPAYPTNDGGKKGSKGKKGK